LIKGKNFPLYAAAVSWLLLVLIGYLNRILTGFTSLLIPILNIIVLGLSVAGFTIGIKFLIKKEFKSYIIVGTVASGLAIVYFAIGIGILIYLFTI
jgi:hypothetical protein